MWLTCLPWLMHSCDRTFRFLPLLGLLLLLPYMMQGGVLPLRFRDPRGGCRPRD